MSFAYSHSPEAHRPQNLGHFSLNPKLQSHEVSRLPERLITPDHPVLDGRDLEKQMEKCKLAMHYYACFDELKDRHKYSRSQLGSLFHKQALESIMLSNRLDQRYQEYTYQCLKETARYYSKYLPDGEAGGRAMLAGALGEAAVAETLDQTCLIPTYPSTIEQDTMEGKIDLLADPGKSEYHYHQQLIDRYWAIQVKASSKTGTDVIAFSDEEQGKRQLSKSISTNNERELDRFNGSISELSTYCHEFDNVDGVLIIVPNIYARPEAYNRATGRPSEDFKIELEDKIANLPDYHQLPDTYGDRIIPGVNFAVAA